MDEAESGFGARVLNRFFNPIVLALIGAIILGLGVIIWKTWESGEPEVEILSESIASNQTKGESKPEASPTIAKEIIVEVSGSVEKPGVYKLHQGDRVEDALVISGGVSARADRDYLGKYVNRAKVLIDGEKIYIPATGEMDKIALEGVSTYRPSEVAGINIQVGGKTNINSASQSQLEDLWGVGEVTAKKIIENRPYSQVDELLQKKILKKNIYDRIREELSVN